MNEPKITVIIPTRERCSVLDFALRTATAQNFGNLEIIVSDNFSADDTHSVVQRANDRRVRYVNTGKRLSMSHNWEFALSHVEDGWVTVMGDDDGLMPDAISTVAGIIKDTGAKAIRSTFCTYDWPGTTERTHGQLIVPLGTGTTQRPSRTWLSRVMQGSAKYNQLPMLYNGGFIHVSILRQIRQSLGAFFRSANPDVFSAVAISRLVDSYVFSRAPLAISGTSRYSNGLSAFSASKQRNIDAYKQFLAEGNIPFHREVPMAADGGFPLSLQACVYEAYLQSAPLGAQVESVSHVQQLPVIIATAGKHRESIEQWGKFFAEMHNLDMAAAMRTAAKLRLRLQTLAMARKTLNALNAVIVERLPIRNIHEASIAAAVIRSSPNRWDTLDFLGRQFRQLFRHA